MNQPLEHENAHLDLSDALDFDPGYHGTGWVDLTEGEPTLDEGTPPPLARFLDEVATMVDEVDPARQWIGRIGCAYMRIIDGSEPENYMLWHRDNEDGGVRFHTAISSDGAPVNLAWPQDPNAVGKAVEHSDWQSAYRPGNGVIVGFTTEPHGVPPLPERPGERTAIFFTTLYKTRKEADLYTTNNSKTEGHATLQQLEGSRS